MHQDIPGMTVYCRVTPTYLPTYRPTEFSMCTNVFASSDSNLPHSTKMLLTGWLFLFWHREFPYGFIMFGHINPFLKISITGWLFLRVILFSHKEFLYDFFMFGNLNPFFQGNYNTSFTILIFFGDFLYSFAWHYKWFQVNHESEICEKCEGTILHIF